MCHVTVHDVTVGKSNTDFFKKEEKTNKKKRSKMGKSFCAIDCITGLTDYRKLQKTTENGSKCLLLRKDLFVTVIFVILLTFNKTKIWVKGCNIRLSFFTNVSK